VKGTEREKQSEESGEGDIVASSHLHEHSRCTSRLPKGAGRPFWLRHSTHTHTHRQTGIYPAPKKDHEARYGQAQ